MVKQQRGDDLIRRADAIQALVECEDIKGIAYVRLEKALNAIPKIDVAYICNRLRCETCHDECELTRDINYAADTSKAVVMDAGHSSSSEKPTNSDPCDGCIYDNDENVLACIACVMKDKQEERSK